MPVAVAIAIRYIIMAAVQLGIWSLIEKYGIPLLNAAISEVAQLFGATEEEAQDIIANQVLQAFEQVGIFAVTLKSKLPIKVAERLGFTSKGFALRKLSPTLAAKLEKTTIPAVTTAVATTAEVAQVATSVSRLRGLNSIGVLSLLTIVMGVVSLTSNLILAAANVMDFGNWQGAYQKTFQKLFTALGFPPDTPMPKARTVSQDTWTKIYATVEELNPQTIAFPWDDTVKPYSRNNLADAVDHFAANIAASGRQATFKNVFGLLLPCIKINPSTTTSTSTSTTLPSSSQATTTAKVTVFTGVVSQGTLGNGIVFSPRTNDMIDDVNELVSSASVNLANFLTALPSRVIYEIKIVSSITTKDGFTQRGSTNKVQVGTYSNGQPKYKTVTNKFAVLYLYLLTDKGTKTKIATVNVGPVNAINFQVTSNDLDAVADRLKGVVTTSNVNEIKTIVSDTPIAVVPVPEPVLPLPNYNIAEKVPNDLGYAFYKRPADKSNPASYVVVPNYKFYNPEYSQITEEEYRRATGDKKDYTNSGYQIVNGAFTLMTTYKPSDTNPPATQAQLAQANLPWSGSLQATSIAYFYDPEGKKYPSVAERALLYEQYGLGSKTLYIGSTEQNIQLLAKLKGF